MLQDRKRDTNNGVHITYIVPYTPSNISHWNIKLPSRK